jgi:hypothetical protein
MCRSNLAKDLPISCKYATRDGEAEGGADYEDTSGVLVFPPGVDTRMITVRIYTDDEVEDDERFYIDLYSAEPPRAIFKSAMVRPA